MGKRSPVRMLAAEEEGGAALEFALVAGLAAFFAFTMKQVVATPMLDGLTKAMRVLSQALSG